jgi:(p)ppGpp synthase/HD superfamily hydrolase
MMDMRIAFVNLLGGLMPDPYSPLVEAALIFAARAHQRQFRKATDVPYIVHPVGVMLILQQTGETDPELLAAGVLHDTIEDAGVSADALAARFGPRVAEIVVGCTEPDHATAAWEIRKEHTIAYLRTAPREIQLVAAADKLHNIWSMAADYAEQGERLWGRFNRGRPAIEWYYRALADSLGAGDLRDHPIVQQLHAQVAALFG